MNRPNFNSPKPSPGFVYFQTGQPNPADTSEFLAFSDSKQSPQQDNVKSFHPRSPMHPTRSPMHHVFTPDFTSSPNVKSFHPRSPMNQTRSPAFNPNSTSSPVNFKRGNSRNNWSQNRRNYTHNRHNSSYNSTGSNRSFHNDSWNSNSSVSTPRRHNRKRNSNGEEKINIDEYIHPSFFEDPWADLVKKIEQSWAEDGVEEGKAKV